MGTQLHLSSCLVVHLGGHRLHESRGCLYPDPVLCSFGAGAVTHIDWGALRVPLLSARTEGPWGSPGGVGRWGGGAVGWEGARG